MPGIYRYIIFIVLIFLVLVLGQQPYFENLGRIMWQKIQGGGMGIWARCVGYWNTYIYKSASSEFEKRQDIAVQEIGEQTKEVGESIWQKTKNYFVGIFTSIFTPGK